MNKQNKTETGTQIENKLMVAREELVIQVKKKG